MRILMAFVLAICAARAGDKPKSPLPEGEKATVLSIESRLISTGTQESGRIDKQGNYSGSTEQDGYRVIEYVLRLANSTVIVQLDPRPSFGPLVNPFARGNKPTLRAGDTAALARTERGAHLVAGGKAYSVRVVKETLATPVTPSNHRPTGEQESAELIAKLRAEFMASPGVFLQKRIMVWTAMEVAAVAGAPTSRRNAYDREKNISGEILAYSDPSNANEKIECRFDGVTKKLQNLYLYPRNMTWEDCRRTWGENVVISERAGGNRFYEYQDRRLMVLVDKSGRVLNLTVY